MRRLKKYFVFFVCLIVSYSALSQDIIITNDGDTIKCKITRIENEYIHFSVYDNGILSLKSRLPHSAIQSFFQKSDEEEKENVNELKNEEVFFDEITPTVFRLSLNAGFTYQVEGYEGYPSSYKNQLQTFFHYGGDLHFFMFRSNFGIGIKYNRIQTKANEDFEQPFIAAFGFSELRDEEIIFRYLGASFTYRHYLLDDQVLNFSLGAGNVKYSTEGFGDGILFYEEGETLGITLGLSYDLIFVQYFGIGFGVEANIANLDEITKDGVTLPIDFGISRIDFTLGFRIY